MADPSGETAPQEQAEAEGAPEEVQREDTEQEQVPESIGEGGGEEGTERGGGNDGGEDVKEGEPVAGDGAQAVEGVTGEGVSGEPVEGEAVSGDGVRGEGGEEEGAASGEPETVSAEQPPPEEQLKGEDLEVVKEDQEAAGEEVVEKEASEPFRTEEAIEPEGGQAVSDEVTEVVEEPSTPETRPTNGGGGEESPTRLILQPAPLEDIAEEEEEVDRETIIQEIKEQHAEQKRLRGINAQLQHKIAEYLARKKTEEKLDPGKNVTDQEKSYAQCMAALDSIQQELVDMQRRFGYEEQQLQVLQEQKLAEVDQAVAELAAYRRQYAVTAIHSRSGKRLTRQEVDQFQEAEARKELEVIQVRLENVKLQNRLQKLETLIKEKDQLAEGLHMIDFEQLKINNVDLNEKIEERNEDITKLKRKVTSTVQVLTHVKEKLQFLQAENSEKKATLQEVEAVVAVKRDHLTRMKQARDALRMDNIRLRQRGGLVSHSALLRDFEERMDQSEELRRQLAVLQQRHSELTVLCDGLKRRIDQTKSLHPHM